MLRWPNICFPASLKERKENYVFATDLAIWNSSHHPFLGLKLLSLRSAISLCFVSVSAGEILNSLCTKLFKFYIILKLCFGVGAHRLPHLAERALCRLWSGSVLIFKSPFPSPVPPFWRGFCEVCLVRILQLIGLKCPLLGVVPLGADWEREKPIVQLFWYWKLKCLFKIKNQFLQLSDLLDLFTNSNVLSPQELRFGLQIRSSWVVATGFTVELTLWTTIGFKTQLWDF